MKKMILFGFLLFLLGLGSMAVAQDDQPLILAHDGLERTYFVHIPDNYDSAQAAPLVIALHGSGGTGDQLMRVSGFNALADRTGTIVTYPNGEDLIWDYLDIPVNREVVLDDLGFIEALIDQLSEDYTIDADRIYITGFSNGGLMALRASCELADRLAAVVILAANLTFRLAEGCIDAEPIPLMLVLGTADDIFPWLGAMEIDEGRMYSSLSMAQTTGFFTSLAQCTETPDAEDMTFGGSPVRVFKQVFAGCMNEVEYVIYGLADFGHGWPDAPRVTLSDDSGGTILEAAWEFFGAHEREDEN